jgi:hypothetical protein
MSILAQLLDLQKVLLRMTPNLQGEQNKQNVRLPKKAEQMTVQSHISSTAKSVQG